MQYDRRELTRQMKRQIDAAIKADRVQPSVSVLRDYERGLDDYTYLSFNGAWPSRLLAPT